MGKLFTSSKGTAGLCLAADEPLGMLPADATNVVAFDEGSNASLLADFKKNSDLYTIVAGVVKRSGVTVTVNPDSQAKQDRDGLLAAAAAAIQANTDFIALASPTNAQTLAEVKALAQQNNRIIKRLIQLTS